MQNLGKVVSIVDDDSDIVQLFHDALEHLEGVNIFTFIVPIAALQHFQENEYAYVLVISDYKMPGLNGVELVNKVKSLNQFVRTILMSAFEVDDIRFQQYAKKKNHKCISSKADKNA